MADLDHALQTYELSFVHLIAPEQLGVVAEVAQEPVQLPQGFRAAIEAARKDVPGKPARLKNGQSKCVVGLLCLPLKLDSLHADEENPVGDLVGGTAIGGVQASDLPFHAAPSFARHRSTMLDASKHRELFPAGSGREGVEVDQRMPCTVTSLTFTTPHKSTSASSSISSLRSSSES